MTTTSKNKSPSEVDPDLKSDRLPSLSALDLKKLPTDGGPEYNRLIFQKSPYLLQHATATRLARGMR